MTTKTTTMTTVTTGRAVSADGTAIAYDRTGEGPPVVLVGGAMSWRSFPTLAELARLLSGRFTVYGYDRRGRGDSGDTAPYAVEREVEDLAAVIEAAGGSARVWGLSSGAALALRAAAEGLPIERLALYEPPFLLGEGIHRPPADHHERLAELAASGRRGEAISYFMTAVMGAPAFVPLVMRLMPVWKRLKAVAHTLPYDAAIMGDYALPDLSEVTVPTLVVGGEKSPESLRRAVTAVAEAVPGARGHMLAGQNHNVSMKALAPVLADFFS
ncbi:alpha/beta hydrolase [Nonomuraea sp. 3-1Str]|uniref:alpha/beta fold hydrolase n=1 Tax=Nonomuraea sp. 3-1Str TaxID=2929801 RepID=UPI00285D4F6F|nr:alpha/beta hydrolase [Nonomuraea sp. 3-1Str]MDR8410048.1 alpha/beta hydrolase [Nonomuraea sp. 3-1Str]